MMSQHGLQSLFPMEDLAVMGIWELLPHLNKIRVRLKKTVEAASFFKPHVVVTVDAKGFSFCFLKELRATTALLCDLVHNSTFNLEEILWPSFVEICLYDKGKDTIDWKVHANSQEFRSRFEIPPGAEVVTFLPGSRLQEVRRMVPIFLKVIEILKGSFPELRTIMLVASNQHVENFIGRLINHWPVPCTMIPGSSAELKYDAFSASTAALCTSGTAAVELQLARLPCLVAYRAHILTEWLIRYKAIVPYISLPNILLDSPVIPEALFDACTPHSLASTLTELIQDSSLQEQQIKSAERVVSLLSASMNNTVKHGAGDALQPSMIAASTILHYKRHQ